jgi:hypothetical protein
MPTNGTRRNRSGDQADSLSSIRDAFVSTIKVWAFHGHGFFRHGIKGFGGFGDFGGYQGYNEGICTTSQPESLKRQLALT